MAIAADLKKGFGRRRRGIHFLAELKWNNRILIAVHDQNGGVDFLQPNLSIELPLYKKAQAGEKPENPTCDSRSGGKRGLKH